VSIKDLIEVKKDFPGADFWVQRTGQRAGYPSKLYSPKDFGVKILRTDILDPGYLYYWYMNLFNQGFFRSSVHGAVIPFLRKKDIEDALKPLITPRSNPTHAHWMYVLPIPLEPQNFFHDSQLDWWRGLIPLGKLRQYKTGGFVRSHHYDLGVYHEKGNRVDPYSFAMRYGPEDSQYTSGEISFHLAKLEESRRRSPKALRDVILRYPAHIHTLERLEEYLIQNGLSYSQELPHMRGQSVELGEARYIDSLLLEAGFLPACEWCGSRQGTEDPGDGWQACIECGGN